MSAMVARQSDRSCALLAKELLNDDRARRSLKVVGARRERLKMGTQRSPP
jgi:hypothetical protein